MNQTIPRVLDFHYFHLDNIIDRWWGFDLTGKSSKDEVTRLALRIFADEGLIKQEVYKFYLPGDVIFLGGFYVTGDKLIAIEFKHLRYEWRWEDHLYPDWSSWCAMTVLAVEDAVCLSVGIDPAIPVRSGHHVAPLDTYAGELMSQQERISCSAYVIDITSDRLTTALNSFLSRKYGLSPAFGVFTGSETAVEFPDFIQWAVEWAEWVLPRPLIDYYQRNILSQNSSDRPTYQQTNTTVNYSVMNVDVDAREQHLKQVNIVQGVTPARDEPDHNSQTVEPILKPEALRSQVRTKSAVLEILNKYITFKPEKEDPKSHEDYLHQAFGFFGIEPDENGGVIESHIIQGVDQYAVNVAGYVKGTFRKIRAGYGYLGKSKH